MALLEAGTLWRGALGEDVLFAFQKTLSRPSV